jgi:hypothetical protein
MSVKNQHEIHPDAEVLSAFAEQALGERERGEVLEHLAGCGRCRQVVALAREAAGAEVAARRQAPVRPRVWFRSWGLALAPLAAIAASAVVAIYVHERNVERSVELAKVEQQRPAEKAPMPSQAAPEPPAQAGPPTVSPAEKPGRPERAGAARHAPVAEPDEPAVAPPPEAAPEAANAPLASREEPGGTPGLEGQGTADGAYVPAEKPAGDRTRAEVALYDEERNTEAQAQMEVRDKHLSAAKRKAAAGEQGPGSRNSGSGPAGSGTAGSSEQVVVTDQQLETQPAPAATVGSLMKLRPGAFSGTRGPSPVHLPSGLPTISIAHEGERMIAIDNAGALFVSEDSGATWEAVTTQWTGRAVLVRKKTSPQPEEAAPPAAKAESSGDTSGSGAVSESDTVFELLNDQGQVWLSKDGKIWAAR